MAEWIGVISDTHTLLRPEAIARLRGASHILHAGDIGAPGLVERLPAPVTAIRGNVDVDEWAEAFPDRLTCELFGLRIHMVHARADIGAEAEGADVVVFGHSHKPLVERAGGRLLLNPGSAGPRRFALPVTVAVLRPGPAGAEAEILPLLD